MPTQAMFAQKIQGTSACFVIYYVIANKPLHARLLMIKSLNRNADEVPAGCVHRAYPVSARLLFYLPNEHWLLIVVARWACGFRFGCNKFLFQTSLKSNCLMLCRKQNAAYLIFLQQNNAPPTFHNMDARAP